MDIKLTQKQVFRKFKGCFYGKPGVGKTRLAASAEEIPEFKDVLLIDAEAGTASLDDTNPTIPTVTIEDWAQFAKIHDFLRTHCRYKEQYKLGNKEFRDKLFKLEEEIRGGDSIGKEPLMIETVILDSITEIQKFAMAFVLEIDLATWELDNPFKLPKFKEWGENTEYVRLLVRHFRNLGVNLILTAHDKSDRDDRTGKVDVLPSLPGKLPNEILGFLDVCGYLYVPTKRVESESSDEAIGDFRNVILFQPNGKYIAKDRYTRLGTFMVNPTMKKIVEKLKGEKVDDKL